TAGHTVAQMLERDDFAKRYRAEQPISLIELIYPLLQGYDSVAVEADVELGGTDQLFNLLVGRSVQRAHGQRPQIALTTPLLVGLDGSHKMSQSLGNYVGVRDDAQDMFGKLMSIPDELVAQYAALGAWWEEAAVAELGARAEGGGPEAGEAKRSVARSIVARYHGRDAARSAEEAFDRTFRERGLPEEIQETAIPSAWVKEGSVYLPGMLAELGLAPSRSAARRLLEQGGVRVDGARVEGEQIAPADLEGRVLQVGKRKFLRLRRGAG
ncbi:MAG: tyrosine--tRNA ligase, partial [Acidobacteria bacterium]|nr:tyrosine--tRNA ligase [Acidobacteriota bacterium]